MGTQRLPALVAPVHAQSVPIRSERRRLSQGVMSTPLMLPSQSPLSSSLSSSLDLDDRTREVLIIMSKQANMFRALLVEKIKKKGYFVRVASHFSEVAHEYDQLLHSISMMSAAEAGNWLNDDFSDDGADVRVPLGHSQSLDDLSPSPLPPSSLRRSSRTWSGSWDEAYKHTRDKFKSKGGSWGGDKTGIEDTLILIDKEGWLETSEEERGDMLQLFNGRVVVMGYTRDGMRDSGVGFLRKPIRDSALMEFLTKSWDVQPGKSTTDTPLQIGVHRNTRSHSVPSARALSQPYYTSSSTSTTIAVSSTTTLSPSSSMANSPVRAEAPLTGSGPLPWRKNRKPLLAERCPINILIADDNLTIQKVAGKILERFGYKSATSDTTTSNGGLMCVVSNGMEAIQMLEKQHYHVVLMDQQMPVLDGCEAARQIRSTGLHSKWGNIHIIAMTANCFQEDRDRCLASGMCSFLSKPVRPHELKKELKHAYAIITGGCLQNTPAILSPEICSPNILSPSLEPLTSNAPTAQSNTGSPSSSRSRKVRPRSLADPSSPPVPRLMCCTCCSCKASIVEQASAELAAETLVAPPVVAPVCV
eukprot:TRINITY_DN1696_c0_g1_i1.p1 TRINITY_DN1696_c0_g1~~TRINITY_DN1696_c0_g1_i1.p1  ORF type:complete len:642 (-),score=88.33 TRINITY_DN1696_c0_g1_i1:803-2566(-)